MTIAKVESRYGWVYPTKVDLQNNCDPMLSVLWLAFLAFLAGNSKVVEEEAELHWSVVNCAGAQ